jgi:hypothetical protein
MISANFPFSIETTLILPTHEISRQDGCRSNSHCGLHAESHQVLELDRLLAVREWPNVRSERNFDAEREEINHPVAYLDIGVASALNQNANTC